MFWTEFGKTPRIEQASMDGSKRRIIVRHNTTWPNGLALDFESSRLYWVDAGTHRLESSDLDGKDRIVRI